MKEAIIFIVGIVLLGLAGLVGDLTPNAYAATLGFSNCRGTAIPPPTMRKRGEQACYEFDDATDSGGFVVISPSALLCLDPDVAAAGTSTAEVMIRRCHIGFKPAADPTHQCEGILDASLDGTAGASATQDMCLRVGPGSYYFDVTSADTNGKDAVMTMTAE